ncbi:hypothetical protein NW757_013555 [Fusarium falciforme]|nr:hypothetical protein NW757_013555 [Fusarium falciforme]
MRLVQEKVAQRLATNIDRPDFMDTMVRKEGALVKLGIWQWALNRDPNNFTDPETFIPERWLGDPRFANDKTDALQPFSYGPRNCIGKK